MPRCIYHLHKCSAKLDSTILPERVIVLTTGFCLSVSCEPVGVSYSFFPYYWSHVDYMKETSNNYYTKLKAVNRARAWPLLSFHQKQLCPSLSLFILASSSPSATALSPAVLHWSLLTQNMSLCQGKTTSLLSHSWHWRLTLAFFCPQNTSPIALSRKLAKRNEI